MIEFYEQLAKRWVMAEDSEWLKMDGGAESMTEDELCAIIDYAAERLESREMIIADIAATYPLRSYINDANTTRMQYCSYCRIEVKKGEFLVHVIDCVWERSKALVEQEMRAEVNKQEIKDG